MPANKTSPIVRLLPETREKLERIAELRRWKLGVVVDEAIKRYIEVEGITFPQVNGNRRRKASA